jgi:predicted Ser/Thr protein kinase
MNRSVMNDANRCRACGVELPENAAQARCERCLTSERLLLSQWSSSSAAVKKVPGTTAEETGNDFGDYVLLNEIARGGMGCVHRARQKSLNRIVAIKRPLPGVSANEERVRRFRIEAEAVAALSHPNIIPIFESGEWHGEQYFSMAYVEGESLADVVRLKAVTPKQAARYVQKIAEAIHHAHQRGVLHRDLKPGNVIIDAADEPRVADFGLAQLLEGSDSTLGDSVAGTAHYMAPEQIQPGNQPLSVVTDVYALGGILYHLLTGLPPFQGNTREQVFWSVFYEEAVPPTQRNQGVNRDLEAICLKALEKDPAQRYSSAYAMAVDLDRFLEGRPVTARPIGYLERSWMWVRRNPVTAGLVLLLSAALATGIILQWFSLRKVRSARAASEEFIGFMNGDLVQDLRELGRLDLMEKVNAKAENYYTNYSAVGDPGYWERKALFYENAAAVEKDLSDMARAETRAIEAEAIYQRQQEHEPREPRWKRRQSLVRLLRLQIARNAGLRPVANQHGETAVALASAAMHLAPTDITNRANLAHVLLEQANLWIEQKRTESPSTNVARAEAILQEVAALPGADPEWSLWLAHCAYYRGLVAQLRRNPEGALSEFTESLARMQAVVRRFPKNTRWQYELVVAYARVGEALFNLKAYAEARAYVDIFEASAQNLTQIDPRNTAWLALYARSLTWKGSLARALEPASTSARDYFRASLTVQSNLTVRNQDWDRWIDATAQTTFDLAQWHRTHGENKEALSVLGEWRRQCHERALRRPEHIGHQLRWGQAITAETDMIGRIEGRDRQVARLQESLTEFAVTSSQQPVVLAKARVLARLADALDASGFPENAAVYLHDALRLRLAFFDHFPLAAKVREQISDTFAWTVAIYIRAEAMGRALDLADEGFDWAARNLFPEEARSDYARMCRHLIQVGDGTDAAIVTRIKRLVHRCLGERLTDSPPLTIDEQAQAEHLQNWLSQHP